MKEQRDADPKPPSLKRVAFLVRHLQRDGGPWLTDDLVAELVDQGASVDVFYYCMTDEMPTTGPHHAEVNFHIVHNPSSRARGSWRQRLRFVATHLAMLWRFGSCLARTKFDVSVCYTAFAWFWPLIPVHSRLRNAINYGIVWDFYPIQTIEMGRMPRDSRVARVIYQMENSEFRARDHLLVMTPANATYMTNYHPDLSAEVTPVYLWRRVESFIPSVGLPQLRTGLDYVVFGGSLEDGRDLGSTIEAAEILAYQCPDVRLLLIGGGTEADRLRADIDSRGLTNVVVYDRVGFPEYLSILQYASVGLVMLSETVSSPSFPSKMLDYMFAELPIVIGCGDDSDVGDIIETQFHCGIKFQLGDPQSLASAIEVAVRSPELGQCGRQTLESTLSPRSIVKILTGSTEQ